MPDLFSCLLAWSQPHPLKLSPLNDVAGGTEDGVLHVQAVPGRTTLGPTGGPFLEPNPTSLPSIVTALPTLSQLGSPAWVVLGLRNKGVFLGSVTN